MMTLHGSCIAEISNRISCKSILQSSHLIRSQPCRVLLRRKKIRFWWQEAACWLASDVCGSADAADAAFAAARSELNIKRRAKNSTKGFISTLNWLWHEFSWTQRRAAARKTAVTYPLHQQEASCCYQLSLNWQWGNNVGWKCEKKIDWRNTVCHVRLNNRYSKQVVLSLLTLKDITSSC